MPSCNGADRGCAARQHHPTRKGADFPLVFRHKKVVANRSKEQADMSAGATLSGAAPDRKVRRLPASIVKVVPGKEPRPLGPPLVPFCSRGVSNAPQS